MYAATHQPEAKEESPKAAGMDKRNHTTSQTE